MKKVLVTNDDGIGAPGIMAIVTQLVSTGKYDVRVAAPSEEQSAKAHSITIHGLLNVEKLILPDPLSHIVAWQITGTPADSVKIALNTQLWDGWTPDLVISGINYGLNTGHTIHYSGTVGAAREANISGYPAIAISIEWAPRGGLMYFNDVAIYSLSLVELVLQESEKNPEQARQTVWNANFPNVPISKILGWKYTKQGASCIKNQYKLHHSEINPEGELMKQSYRLIGALQLDDLTEEYDTYAVLHKYASVSLLGLFHRHKNDHQNFISQCENWSIFSNKSNTEA